MNGNFEKKTYFQLKGSRKGGTRGYAPMFHPHGELVHAVQGTLGITVDGVEYRLEAGQTAVIFPYLTHSYEKAPDAKSVVILFDPAATAFDATLLEKKPVCCRVEDSRIYPLMDRAVTMIRRGKRKTAMGYLNAVLGELLELLELEDRDGPAGDAAVQLLSYCEEHFSEDITVEKLAEALFISSSYVSKLFSQKLKTGFRSYINDLRVRKAQTLLRETDQKILQIMEACGFQNQSSFNRVFRGITGLSPRQYRQAHRPDQTRENPERHNN